MGLNRCDALIVDTFAIICDDRHRSRSCHFSTAFGCPLRAPPRGGSMTDISGNTGLPRRARNGPEAGSLHENADVFSDFLLCRNHLISIITLSWAPPLPPGHPPVARVPYYLFTIMERFPEQVLQRHRNAPPPPMGAWLAHSSL